MRSSAAEDTIETISGKTLGLKPSEMRQLERLSQRRLGNQQLFPTEVARAMCSFCDETGRMIALLVDRRGNVDHVVVGEATRIYLPEIGRLRAGEGRLRGLRLLVVKPASKHANTEISNRQTLTLDSDLVTDLEKLKLDAVVQIEALDSGLTGRAVWASLLPQANFDAVGKEAHHRIEHVAQIADLDRVQFDAFIADLEASLTRTSNVAKEVDKVAGEREAAVLVGVYASKRGELVQKDEWQASMNELKELARTAGVRVADVVMQQRRELDPRTVVGKGKLEEICLLALHRGAEMIIFDCDLSPSQLNAITDLTDLKVIDRTMLILDIFARRARSREGRMQVELAQLRYSLPRLAKKQTGLSRLTGGIGGQGPGETKLEIDRRRAKDRLTRLEREVEQFSRERQLRRRARNERELPIISIVGYTNAGKSTLLNALTGADVYSANELFATLDPTSRRLRFPEEKDVILTDTVGFIRDLPTSLVNAFRGTLEELSDADLLLHVVDASDPRRQKHIEAVEAVLAELKIDQTPRLLVLNKTDTLDAESAANLAHRLDAVGVSAINKTGFEDLVGRMRYLLWTKDPDDKVVKNGSLRWKQRTNVPAKSEELIFSADGEPIIDSIAEDQDFDLDLDAETDEPTTWIEPDET